MYEGLMRKPDLVTAMTQTLRGFYGSSSATLAAGVVKARLTHIAASGQPNPNDRILFSDKTNSTLIVSNPFAGATSSERSYRATFHDVSSYVSPGNNSSVDYGETATTSVEHSGGGGYDCVTWNAVIFSTAIADVDLDGLPDALESRNATDTAQRSKQPDAPESECDGGDHDAAGHVRRNQRPADCWPNHLRGVGRGRM